MKFTKCLPDHIIKLNPHLGLKTMDEINSLAEIKNERELHKHIGNLLRQRGIEFFESRMDKRTGRPVGEPDFVFSVLVKLPPSKAKDPFPSFADSVADFASALDIRSPIACGWELKLPGRVLDPDQVAMFDRLTKPPNAWCCRIIHSVDEALAELKKLGL